MKKSLITKTIEQNNNSKNNLLCMM